ncbi:hypothetical protein [Microtetraspora glauca]|uniref:Lipoprotein n=1 Tax=Microtetraspora glauca TaxID=1996 RepID=A0ABV3GSJ6_MICGL
MKRVIVGISAASAAAFVTAAPAQAAPADPIKALKGQFVAGKGVKFTDRTTLTGDGTNVLILRRTGSFQFGRSGIVASDISAKAGATSDEPAATAIARLTPERTIRIGTTSYTSGGVLAEKLPKGKVWYKDPQGMAAGGSGWFGQIVNVAEPATLQTLLRSAKKSHTTYSGTITFGKLAKISPWFRASLRIWSKDTAVAKYSITMNRDGLPQRLTTSYPATGLFDSNGWEGKTISVETRFTDWGGKVSIKAPPASKVTAKLDDD